MKIKTLSGRTIIKTNHKTLRRMLEYCAEEGIDLSGADLRKARLCHAGLDGLKAQGACFWGADFTASDIGFADFRGADLRCVNFKDACLAESDLSGARLQGAYFSGTIVENADFSCAHVSCPSFWDCDMQGLAALKGLVYDHLGEAAITFSKPPLIIRGLEKRLVLTEGYCIWGSSAYPSESIPFSARKAIFTAKTTLERAMQGDVSRCAKKPIPKIGSLPGSF